MGNKSQTKQVHNEADLNRLIAGDNVNVELVIGLDLINNPLDLAYEGMIIDGNVSFLMYDDDDNENIYRILVRKDKLSFEDGTILANNPECEHLLYESYSSLEYQKAKELLKRAGLI